jgi:hypothetical protein
MGVSSPSDYGAVKSPVYRLQRSCSLSRVVVAEDEHSSGCFWELNECWVYGTVYVGGLKNLSFISQCDGLVKPGN